MRTKQKQFLVLGLGRFGDSVARNLYKMGYEVMAVDTDAALVDDIAPYVTQAVQADVTDEDALDSIGIRNFDVAVVSIGQIRDSILAVVLLKEAGISNVIAKASDELHAKVLKKVGADRVVFPEREMGMRIAKSLVSSSVMDLMELSNDYQIVEVLVPEKWAGNSIAGLDVRKRFGLSILAVHRQEDFLVSPGADFELNEGDLLLVLGKQTDIDSVAEK